MDMGVPVEINVKDLRKEYEKALKEGRKHIQYKGLSFYRDYVKYLLEYVEGQGKESFRISEADIPKK